MLFPQLSVDFESHSTSFMFLQPSPDVAVVCSLMLEFDLEDTQPFNILGGTISKYNIVDPTLTNKSNVGCKHSCLKEFDIQYLVLKPLFLHVLYNSNHVAK